MDRSRKHALTHLLAAAIGGGALLALGAGRTNTAAEPPEMPSPEQMQEGMEKWVAGMQPGKMHAFLEQFVGEWDTQTRMFMAPGMDPLVNPPGTASLKMVLGGRFLQQTTTGKMEFPGMDGKPMSFDHEGMGLTGYDNARKLFSFVWADTTGTALYTGSGSLSRDGSTLTMFGTMDEPMTGEVGKTIRYTTRAEGKDKFVFEVAEVLYGEPFTVVQIEYTRKK